MKRKTLLMLVISIVCVLGASTLVYNALAPDDTNYEARSDGSVLENTSMTAFPAETTVPSDTNLTDTSAPPDQTSPAAANTTAAPKAKAAVTTTPAPAATTAPAAAAPPAATTAPPAATAAKAGNAPDFTVYDAGGNTVKLSDYRGKPVVLNFWASWCGPCKAEMPHLQSMYNQYGGSVIFLMINLTDGSRETKQSAQSFISTNGYTFPIYFDTQRSASTAYGISSIPSTFFISKAGDIQSRQIGQISASALESGIHSIQ